MRKYLRCSTVLYLIELQLVQCSSERTKECRKGRVRSLYSVISKVSGMTCHKLTVKDESCRREFQEDKSRPKAWSGSKLGTCYRHMSIVSAWAQFSANTAPCKSESRMANSGLGPLVSLEMCWACAHVPRS